MLRCARDSADDQQLDTLTLAWASHRLGGIQSPANAVYSAEELEYQLKNSGAKALFTCIPLLDTARKAAKGCGIPENRIYLLDLPDQFTGGKSAPKGMKTVDDFIRQGKELDRLEPLKWASGDGAKKTAFLCYSSGTSGLPKGVMISHRNVIANTSKIFDPAKVHKLTVCSADCHIRETIPKPDNQGSAQPVRLHRERTGLTSHVTHLWPCRHLPRECLPR
jgi:long-subunit acyl-CoA synthetase (AMP-forming)